MKIFDQISAALGARVLEESELGAFFRENSGWADSNADYSRIAVLGPRGSVWEEPSGRTYLVVVDDEGSPREYLPNE